MELNINVISEKELKDILGKTCHLIAKHIAPTFGPYGQNTLIQSVDGIYSTKDGWNVAQRLQIIDPNSKTFPIAINAVKSLILDVAFSVVLNGGDGTSTSIMAADAMSDFVNRNIIESLGKSGVHVDVKKLELELRLVTKEIVHELYQQATKVTDENMAEIIRQIALISTNWDEEIANIIRDIYVKTKNPIIKVMNSDNSDTYAEYVEGYDLAGYLMHSGYAISDPTAGKFETQNPVILTFAPGVALHQSDLLGLIAISRMLETENKTLVVLASLYDESFLSGLKSENLRQLRGGLKPLNLIAFKYFAKTAIDKDCVDDFSILVNSLLLTQDNYEDYKHIFESAYQTIVEEGKKLSQSENATESDDAVNLIKTVTEQSIQALYEIAGTCDKLVATEDYILGNGFSNANKEAFEKRKESLEYDIFVQRSEANAESNANDFLRMRRLRLGKLKCHMGIIRVGGFGKANLKSRRDAIDDATRACEVAYEHGYVIDGGLAIPKAIQTLLKKANENCCNVVDRPFYTNVLQEFFNAFRDVAIMLYYNRYHNYDKCIEIFEDALKNNTCYNLLTEKNDPMLITPVDVCKEVLNGCLRLVLVNATSNQFVYQNEDELIRLIKAGSKTREELEVEQAQKEIHGEE